MRRIEIQPHQIRRATKLYDFWNIKDSICKGECNFTGAIGEIIVCDFFREKGSDVNHTSTSDYDMIIDGYTIDVKTKATSVEPQPNYACAVPVTSRHQKPHFFIFARYDEHANVVYILGGLGREKFYKIARLAKKGETDGTGFVYQADCYWCRVDELKPIK